MTTEVEDRLLALENELREARQSNQEHQPKPKRSTPRLLIITVIALVLSAGIVIWLGVRAKSPDLSVAFPAAQKLADTTTLYLPENPPQTFQPDRQSFSYTAGIATYTYRYQNKHAIAVTIQPRPKDLDPTTFNPTKEFTLSIGKAYLADVDPRVTIAVVNDKSFLLINAPDGVPADQMELFVRSFVAAPGLK